MNKEVLSDRQKIFLVSLFLIGETAIYVLGSSAKQDAWLAILLAILIALIMALIYGRLHYLFPEKDLFDMIEILFGKFIGRGLVLLFVVFTFEYVAQELTYLSEYISIMGLPQTPKIAPAICSILLCIWLVKAGIEVIGRCAQLFLPFVIVLIFVTILLLIPDMNVNHLSPVLYNGITPVLEGSFSAFVSPFGEIIIFTIIFSSFKTKKSPYKIYIFPLLIAGITLVTISTANLLVLGVDISSMIYFPSHFTVSIINIGNTIQRMEIVAAIVFIIGGIIKASIMLLATSKGLSKIFRFADYRFIVTAIALLAVNLFSFQFESSMEAYEFYFEAYPYLAVLLQTLFPITIWIFAEVRNKRSKASFH